MSNNLTTVDNFKNNSVINIPTLDSREVAEMMEKDHANLLKDIRKNIGYLAEVRIDGGDFFLQSSYFDGNQQERPCYKITKKGCDFIANKTTGQKGAVFTAKYIDRFYEMENHIQNQFAVPQTFSDALRLAANLVEENQQLLTTTMIKDQQIKELKPKADYVDSILKNKGLVAISQIAKDYGMSGKALNKKLHELGVQYKQSEQWLLYAKYQDRGYTHSDTIAIVRTDGRPDVKMNTKWTQKGRLFLYEFLKDKNILPMIEQQISVTQ